MSTVTVPVVAADRRKTPPRSFQMEDSPWKRLGEVADELGTSRAGLVTALALWFIRWPGAKLPPRPKAQPTDDE